MLLIVFLQFEITTPLSFKKMYFTQKEKELKKKHFNKIKQRIETKSLVGFIPPPPYFSV